MSKTIGIGLGILAIIFLGKYILAIAILAFLLSLYGLFTAIF